MPLTVFDALPVAKHGVGRGGPDCRHVMHHGFRGKDAAVSGFIEKLPGDGGFVAVPEYVEVVDASM